MYQSSAYLAPGQFLFKVLRQLGQGGFGIVEEVEVTESNCAYPVGARLAKKRLNNAWAKEPTAIARFEREITALRTMSHPSILPCMGENLSDGPERFYVMPLCTENLRARLFRNPAGFEWTVVAKFGARLADALQYAHELGFIHRDIKPENILFSSTGGPVIADWGLGYFLHKESKLLVQLTRGGMGTEYYCSLEQWNTGKCDRRGDVYSLGIMLAELVTGRQNRIAHVGAGIVGNIVPSSHRGAMMFNDTICRMTHLLPNRRIPNMRQVAYELSAAADKLSVASVMPAF
jgi:serine/threonine protein kinase